MTDHVIGTLSIMIIDELGLISNQITDGDQLGPDFHSGCHYIARVTAFTHRELPLWITFQPLFRAFGSFRSAAARVIKFLVES